MKKTLIKDSFRDIRHSLGRFLSLMIIVGLGVAFFTGLRLAPKVMKHTADLYYKDYNMRDVQILSTLGLDEEDLKAIKEIDGVKEAEGKYSMDFLHIKDSSESVFKLFDYDENSKIDNYRLIEGRFPQESNEIAIEYIPDDGTYSIGDKIKFSLTDQDIDEYLKEDTYIIVGKVNSPNYLSFEKGTSKIGNGKVSTFGLIRRENFDLDVFTEVDILADIDGEINTYTDEYWEEMDPLMDRLEILKKDREFIRYEKIIKEAKEDLDKAKKDYEEGKSEGQEKLKEAEEDIKKAELDLEKAKRDLKKNERDLKNEVSQAKTKISEEREKLDLNKEELESGEEEFNEKKKMALEEIEKARQELEGAETELNKMNLALEDLNGKLELVEDENIKANLEEEKIKLEAGISQIKAGIEEGNKKIEVSSQELNQGQLSLTESRKMLEEGYSQLNSEEAKLNDLEKDSLEKIRRAKIDIRDGEKDLVKGKEEYQEEKSKFDKEIKEAEEKIKDGEKEIRDIEKGKWYILSREKHYSYKDYEGAADRILALSRVFPAFFVAVASLITITTISRMVDEQRTTIGVIKAIGYDDKDIRRKYLIYGLSSASLGSIIGILVGIFFFPPLVYNTYNIIYYMPEIRLTSDLALIIYTVIGVIVIISGTIILSTREDVKENPASLMRPKAPKLGRKTLIERIPFIWNRFGFIKKITIRNILRYKQRVFMTVLGIAGCTALMIAGFGIRDSIMTVITDQFKEIYKYDISVSINRDDRIILEDDRVSSYEFITKENGKIIGDKKDKDIVIRVVDDIDRIDDFISLRERSSGEQVKINGDGVVITYQLSTDFDLEIGDEFSLQNSDKDENRFKVTGITDNYTFNYVYMTEELYEEKFYKEADFNEALLIIEDGVDYDEFRRDIMLNDQVLSTEDKQEISISFQETIDSLDYVVGVMIFFAGALAVVVLYNLTNINISERIREIATIKVLGFYDMEVAAYIYRENAILTILGGLVGIVGGKYLHRFIMDTIAMDNIIYGLNVYKKSYFYALAITVFFSILVNIIMYYRLRNIKMVESLKSVE